VRNCVLTVVGSQQLAEMIKPLGGHTVVDPTPVDVSKYPMAEPGREGELILVWIGLGKNLRYLEDLGGVLAAMARQFPFKLRVISDRIPNLPGVPLELVPWSEVSEGEELARGHVGLAPLPDDLWTRGKGGYRCIQYAAAGLPCVASPVGGNREVVVPGISGFWASTPEEWWSQLALLFSRPELRRAMGEQARQRALALYDLPKLAPRYIGWLKALLGEDSLSVLGRLDDQQPRTAV
ncbi:MAG: glycosyltransferase, partial [Thermoanaerobaculum sp.]|nr:glycosyltransferase [Thermoanaerobaculum sp.]